MDKLSNATPYLKFTYKTNEESISYLNLIWKRIKKSFETQKAQIIVSSYITLPPIQNILCAQLFLVKIKNE